MMCLHTALLRGRIGHSIDIQLSLEREFLDFKRDQTDQTLYVITFEDDNVARFYKRLQNAGIVTLALVVLWVSGLAIVIIGYLDNPAYLMNQKLWGKFTVVSILTINGLILHYYSFPKLMSPVGFLGAGRTEQLFVLVTAVVSLVSW